MALGTATVVEYLAATGGWNFTAASLTAPPRTASAELLMVASGLSAPIYVDDFTFRQVTAPSAARETPLFADDFELGNLTRWTDAITGRGDLGVSTSAALVETRGLQAVVNDGNAVSVTDDQPTGERHYRARFYFDPNSITMAPTDTHHLFFGYTGSGVAQPVVRIELLYNNGYHLRAALLDDGTTWRNSLWLPIGDAVHSLELEWQAATAPGANNGLLNFWIDGIRRASLGGVDNDTRRIECVRLGALAGIDPSTRGIYYFDAFESRRLTYIGPAGVSAAVLEPLVPDSPELTAFVDTHETDPEEAALVLELQFQSQREQSGGSLYLPLLK
jgi:hypothetical protein